MLPPSNTTIRSRRASDPLPLPATPQPPLSIIQRLPAELQLDISDLLDYQSVIRLSQTNRHFHRLVKPQACPHDEKSSFIRQAQGWDKHNLVSIDRSSSTAPARVKTNGLACFSCYRVLPKQSFSIKQSRDQYNGRRFCVECGLRNGKHRPGSTFKIVTGEVICLPDEWGWNVKDSEQQSMFVCFNCGDVSEYESSYLVQEDNENVLGSDISTAGGTWDNGLREVVCENCNAKQDIVDNMNLCGMHYHRENHCQPAWEKCRQMKANRKLNKKRAKATHADRGVVTESDMFAGDTGNLLESLQLSVD